MIEFHLGRSLAGRHGTQLGGIAEHLRQRDFGDDGDDLALWITALDKASLGGDGAVDVAHVLLGTDDFELHDGFEDDGFGALGGVLEGLAGGDLVGDLGRVDVMVRAESQLAGDVDHLETGDDAAIHELRARLSPRPG